MRTDTPTTRALRHFVRLPYLSSATAQTKNSECFSTLTSFTTLEISSNQIKRKFLPQHLPLSFQIKRFKERFITIHIYGGKVRFIPRLYHCRASCSIERVSAIHIPQRYIAFSSHTNIFAKSLANTAEITTFATLTDVGITYKSVSCFYPPKEIANFTARRMEQSKTLMLVAYPLPDKG